MNMHIKNFLVVLTAVQFLLISGLLPAAHAALIPTKTLIETSATDSTRGQLQAMLARDDVRTELVRLGVDPTVAENRLAALTAEELQQLQGRLNELPAGGNVFAVVGIVFVVLLILEIVGVTNVFSKI
jgi:hypothetical protein